MVERFERLVVSDTFTKTVPVAGVVTEKTENFFEVIIGTCEIPKWPAVRSR